MRLRLAVLAAATLLLTSVSCATLQQIAALRQVVFSLDRVSDLRLAGVLLDGKDSYSDLSAVDVARIAAAVATRDVPLEMVAHVRAENPADNDVSARLVQMDWTLYLQDKRTIDGKLGTTHLLPPGTPVDVPLAVKLDLIDFFGGSGRELVDLALAMAGYSDRTVEVRFDAQPTIETGLGPIRYPQPITIVRREVGQ